MGVVIFHNENTKTKRRQEGTKTSCFNTLDIIILILAGYIYVQI